MNTEHREGQQRTMKSPVWISGDTVACSSGKEPSAADCENFMTVCSPKPPPAAAVVACRFVAARPGVAVAHMMFVIPFAVNLPCTLQYA